MSKRLPTTFDLMEEMRAMGWCVVLKCLPKELGWMIEGSRSEYDAPCPDRFVGKGKWLCEVSWMGKGRYRGGHDSFADTPEEAVRRVFEGVTREQAARKPETASV